jgi:Flp pilus assembly pilin Flp
MKAVRERGDRCVAAGLGRIDHMQQLFVTTLRVAGDRLSALRRDQTGQTLVEYALILTLVSLLTIGTLLVMTGKINQLFTQVANNL